MFNTWIFFVFEPYWAVRMSYAYHWRWEAGKNKRSPHHAGIRGSYICLQLSRYPETPYPQRILTLISFFIKIYKIYCLKKIFPLLFFSFLQSFLFFILHSIFILSPFPPLPSFLFFPSLDTETVSMTWNARSLLNQLHWPLNMLLCVFSILFCHFSIGITSQCFLNILYFYKLVQNKYYYFVCMCEGL